MADENIPEKHKFLLFLSNNEVFVWDKDAIITLRKEYRIVGSLVGSLPSKPRQNLVFSLPLVLQAEEAKLLMEKNVARLVVSDNSSSQPDQDTVERFQEERKANVDEQIEKLKEIKQQKLEEYAGVIEEARVRMRGKRPKRRGRKRKSLLDSDEVPEKKQQCSDRSDHDQTDDGGVHGRLVSDGSRSPNNNVKSLSVSTKCSTDPQSNLKDSVLICVSSQRHPSLLRIKDAEWTFPETEDEILRYKVFLDLWEKGYYITQGSKFGGDYLVYPNDPFRFHSYFVVTVIPWKKSIHALDLVSVGRLGSTVKKTSVLASVDCSKNVIYTSIQWPGFT